MVGIEQGDVVMDIDGDIVSSGADADGACDADACADRAHWGGFRIGGEVTPLEGDTSGIVRAIAPVANSVIHNPNMPAPKTPELAHTLTMTPSAPSLGGMGGHGVALPVRQTPSSAISSGVTTAGFGDDADEM